MHVVPPGIDARASAPRPSGRWPTFVRQHAGETPRPLLVEGTDVGAAILREADHAAWWSWAPPPPTATDGSTRLFGELPEAVAQQARPTVIVVKTRERIARQTSSSAPAGRDARGRRPRRRAGRSVPARVERWFAESNFHHAEFADLRRLVELKEKQGLTISAVLPTLNEAATIGADRAARASAS